MIDVAIVGGGPAGAYCAYNLAENGIYPTIFDHSHPREKPCGGMISPLAQQLFPFLKELPIEHMKKKKVYLIPPSGRKICLNFRRGEVICVSRLKFDQFLLHMALEKGARLIKEKVLDIKHHGDFWEIKTDKRSYTAKKTVGADGVNSVVRSKIAEPLKITDKGICCGYFVENMENEEISFYYLPHRRGYIWISPRKINSSIGIGCTEIAYSEKLREELDMFIEKNYSDVRIIAAWSALIPNIKNARTLYNQTSGKTWVLIGDAAGHANPITGEGILYALLSGELAAKCIVKNEMHLFDKLWKQTYGLNLLLSLKLRKWIYKRPILEWRCISAKIRTSLLQ